MEVSWNSRMKKLLNNIKETQKAEYFLYENVSRLKMQKLLPSSQDKTLTWLQIHN